ncbi:hypothetical protein OHA18_37160 [Kribbella sp. NBC_00709]|uniref:hypothetical protein n=1 Tax=Kribbella sp. NBC_00709 TaxID=2975972 RepID=UPI002E2A40F5|nr:hypothetical protein [Kribbella sp. NBC_00709]
MMIGLLTVAALLGLCVVIWIVRAVHRDDDTARSLLTFACNGLPTGRAAWGQAMLAELGCIEGESARWLFALGGVRAAVAARTVGRLRTLPGLASVLAGVLTCAGLTAAALISHPDLRTSPKIRPFLIVAVVVLTSYAALAVARASDAHPTARSARRLGLLTGAALAVPWFVFAAGWWNLHGAPLILVIATPLVAGVAATRSTGSTHAGVSTATWAGLVAGIAVFVAVAIDGFATADGPYDAGQLSEYAHSGYSSSSAYWMGEDLAESLLLLMIIPCLTISLGIAGAAIANLRGPHHPHR